VQSVPSHADLIATIGQHFSFGTADGRRVEARLVSAPSGIPMDDSYVCYGALFELPGGVNLPQDVYRIGAPDGRAWDLLATPTRPAASGHATMSVVVHRLAPDSSESPAAARGI
jgi:hypothetical protein